MAANQFRNGYYVGDPLSGGSTISVYLRDGYSYIVHDPDFGAGAVTLADLDSYHLHDSDNLTITSPSGVTLADLDTYHLHDAESADLVQVFTLAVAEASHDLVDDGPLTIQAGLTLSVDEAYHLQVTDQADLVQGHSLIVAECYHAHDGPNIELISATLLVVVSADHLHDADSPTLTGLHILSSLDADHLHDADNVELTLGGLDLTVAEAYHDVATDPIDLDQLHILDVDECRHVHRAIRSDLTVTITVAEASHDHTADNIDLGNITISPADGAIEIYDDTVSLTGTHSLAVTAAEHNVSSSLVVLDQRHALSVDEAYHTMYGVAFAVPTLQCADSDLIHTVPNLAIAVDLLIDDAVDLLVDAAPVLVPTITTADGALSVDSGAPDLGQNHHLDIADDALLSLSDTFWIAQIGSISVDGTNHDLSDDLAGLLQLHSLAVADAYHDLFVDPAPVTQDHFLSDNLHSHHDHYAGNIRFAALPPIDEETTFFISQTIQRSFTSVAVLRGFVSLAGQREFLPVSDGPGFVSMTEQRDFRSLTDRQATNVRAA